MEMERSLNEPATAVEDSSELAWPPNGPQREGVGVPAPGHPGLADWLELCTPIGAPALRCHPYGVSYAFVEHVMPLTRPRESPNTWASDEPHDWLERVLSHFSYRGAPLLEGEPERVRRLAELLAPGPRRLVGGLPGYWPTLPDADRSHWWAASRQREGSLGRAVLAASSCDLAGYSLAKVSGDLLGLSDHVGHTQGGTIELDPRGARGYRSTGRRLLSFVGAWPWAHAEDGLLPAEWWRRGEFEAPLRAWHTAAVTEQAERTRTWRWSIEGDRTPRAHT